MLRIEPISNHKSHIPTIAKWHWDAWGHADRNGSLFTWTTALSAKANIDAIPTTYIALSAREEPTGSVVIVESDMSTHPDLGPWIAGLFVIPSHRNQGIGSALMKHATDAAIQMGYQKLYLHTSTATRLYLDLGWKKLYRECYEGEMVDVMYHQAKLHNGDPATDV